MGKGAKSQLTGYRYYFDILMGLCRGPIDQLVAIRVGDVEAWPRSPTGSTPSLTVEQLQELFNPGAAAPPGGFYDNSNGPVDGNSLFSIDQPQLFGGDKSEGGITGNVTLMMGAKNQIAPDNVKRSIAGGNTGFAYTYGAGGTIGTDVTGLDYKGDAVYPDDGGTGSTVQKLEYISDFRGLATMFYSGTVCSNNPYPKTWKMRVRRALTGWDKDGTWYPAKAIIEYTGGAVRAMNPAHIIYQCLTDKTWGRGLDRSEVSDSSFKAAADWLHNEGTGLCMKWSKDQDINEFVQAVINHISAVLYVDRSSGLISLKLIRADYDSATLPVFGYDSGLLTVESSDTGAPSIMVNEIIVKWHDPILDQDRQCRVQNLAAISAGGAIISESKDYPGIPDSDLATRVALRDLQFYAGAFKRFKLTLDRRGWRQLPGSVMKITALDAGVQNMVVRIVTYEDGTALNGVITVECAQDVFSMPTTQFVDSTDSPWKPINSTPPVPPQNQVAYEATYFDMVRGLTTEQRNQIDTTEGGVVVVARRSSPQEKGTIVTVGTSGGDDATASGDFAPAGFISGAIDPYMTSINLKSGTDLLYVVPGMVAVIDGTEFVRVDAFDVTTGALTIARGCVDTIPKYHDDGAVIYFYDTNRSTNTQAYSVGETVNVSTITKTNNDVSDPSSGSNSAVTVTGRWAKPYPPGNVQINGQQALFSQPFGVHSDAVFTWASRNKVVEADQLVSFPEAAVVPEAGTTYNLVIYAHGSTTPIRSHNGLTVTSYNYSQDEWETNGDPNDLDIRLETVVNGVASAEHYLLRLFRTGPPGYGNAYGFYYGGTA